MVVDEFKQEENVLEVAHPSTDLLTVVAPKHCMINGKRLEIQDGDGRRVPIFQKGNYFIATCLLS